MKTKKLSFNLIVIIIILVAISIFFIAKKPLLKQEAKKSLCLSVYEDDIRSGSEINSFFKYVEENYLNDFNKWKLIEKEIYADTIPEGPEHCRVISRITFSVPVEINNTLINFEVSVYYSTNDLSLGDNNLYGPYYTDVKNALDKAISSMEEDIRFNEVKSDGIKVASYDYEHDFLSFFGDNCTERPCYEIGYWFGGGPQRFYYPSVTNFSFAYIINKEYKFPEIISAKQKAQRSLDLLNKENNLSCKLPKPNELINMDLIRGDFNIGEDNKYVIGFNLNEQNSCPCRVKVTFQDIDKKLEYTGTDFIYMGRRGCVG